MTRRRRPLIMASLHFPWSLLIKFVLTGCVLQSLWISNQLHTKAVNNVDRSSDVTAASLDGIVTVAATLAGTPIRGSMTTTSEQRRPVMSPSVNTTIENSSSSSSFTAAAAAATNNDQHQLELRFDWTVLTPHSPLAIRMMEHQTNCDLPLGYFRYRNRFGLGSDLHVYSQALCNAMEQRVRVHSTTPWNWWDVELCNHTAFRDETAMSCYFPASELQCPGDGARVHMAGAAAFAKNISNARGKVKVRCPEIMAEYTVSQIRAAGTEFLFTRVSKHIQDEAARQLNRVFSSNDQVPVDLITVHIRWGDKEQEIKLLGIDSYIQAVMDILKQRKRPLNTANIFLATEDPRALAEFQSAAPVGWKIYVDQYFHDLLPHRRDIYNGPNHMALDLQGKPGPAALGSLLVAMEANDFVLTTASNWSRLMNELRWSILDPACGNCTLLVDLKPGEW
jgi:hypothetical protein